MVRRLLPVVVAVLIFCLAGEVVVRVSGLVDRLNGFPRRLFMATDDPRLPYAMRPGVDAVVWGTRVTVNPQGFRGPAVSPEPAPGVRRVLALGDSATFGQYVAAEEAFPALLERELAARTGERWEVVNAGVDGYNTEAELALLEHRGLALRPEIVVVGFNLNDFDVAPAVGPLGILTRDRSVLGARWSLAGASELYLVLRWLVTAGPRAWRRAEPPRLRGERFSAVDHYFATLRRQYYRRPTDERWGLTAAALRGLGETARRERLRLVVAIIPDGDQVGVPEPDLVPQQKLLAVCAEAGLDCLDLQPRLAAAGPEPLYVDTSHPNAAGQRLIAQALADQLLAGGDGHDDAGGRGRSPMRAAGTPPTIE